MHFLFCGAFVCLHNAKASLGKKQQTLETGLIQGVLRFSNFTRTTIYTPTWMLRPTFCFRVAYIEDIWAEPDARAGVCLHGQN